MLILINLCSVFAESCFCLWKRFESSKSLLLWFPPPGNLPTSKISSFTPLGRGEIYPPLFPPLLPLENLGACLYTSNQKLYSHMLLFLGNISMQRFKETDALLPEILIIKESYNLTGQENFVLKFKDQNFSRYRVCTRK